MCECNTTCATQNKISITACENIGHLFFSFSVMIAFIIIVYFNFSESSFDSHCMSKKSTNRIIRVIGNDFHGSIIQQQSANEHLTDETWLIRIGNVVLSNIAMQPVAVERNVFFLTI